MRKSKTYMSMILINIVVWADMLQVSKYHSLQSYIPTGHSIFSEVITSYDVFQA